MPSGKIYEINEEPQCEPSPEPSPRGLPEIKDLDSLLKEIHKRGGIKLENCNEVQIIQHCIFEVLKDEKVRDANLIFFNMILNYANMFILAYNQSKSMDEKLGIP